LKQQLEDIKKVAAQNAEDNKALQAKLDQAEKDKLAFDTEMAGLKAELEKDSDPTNFSEAKRRVFEKFLGKLDKKLFETKVFQDGKKNIGMFGIISAGKSMLINALFNDKTRCKTGKGETTKEIKEIGECHGVKLWDLPGNSVHFSFLEFQHLCFLASLTKVCVCVESSLLDPFYYELLTICKKLELNVIIAITKWDLAEDDEKAECLKKIHAEAKEVGYGNGPFFTISAQKKLEGDNNYANWGKFIQELAK